MKRHLPYKVPLIILLILFFCLGVDKAMACSEEWEKQFQESIEEECKYIKCLPLDEE